MKKILWIVLMSCALFAFEGLLIPFYHYPLLEKDSEVTKLINLKKRFLDIKIIAIVNPNNGSFTRELYNFSYMIDRLKSAGIEVAGYIHTSYGKRDFCGVVRDIAHWKKFYRKWGVDAIFVDEVSCQEEVGCYYQLLLREIKKNFSKVIFNPGTFCIPSFMQQADIVVIQESNSTSLSSLKKLQPKKAVLLHSIKRLPSLEQFKDVDYLYITEQTLPNPWAKLSSYLEELCEFSTQKVDQK